VISRQALAAVKGAVSSSPDNDDLAASIDAASSSMEGALHRFELEDAPAGEQADEYRSSSVVARWAAALVCLASSMSTCASGTHLTAFMEQTGPLHRANGYSGGVFQGRDPQLDCPPGKYEGLSLINRGAIECLSCPQGYYCIGKS